LTTAGRPLSPLWRRQKDPSSDKQFNERFEHLQADKLEGQVGKLIKLPQLYDLSELAKGLTPQDCESFLLTKERYALWQEMHLAKGRFPDRLPLDGVCLSGPNGVGKSSVLHMLASLSHVNEWLVLYIPRSGEWASRLRVRNELSAEPAATYLLRKFVELNESYAEELERLRPGLWNELQAAVAGKTNALDAQGNLIQTLNLQDRYSVLYAFDEHQTLFPTGGNEDPTQAPINALPSYFKTFTSWQKGTAGLRTFTIYSGSAHSKFEQGGIASGEEHRLRFIRPWTLTDFDTVTRTAESALYIPDLDKCPVEEEYMREVTGQVPRYVRFVKNAYSARTELPSAIKIRKAIESVEIQTLNQATEEIKKSFQSLEKQEKQPFIDYLGHILLPPWYGGLPQARDGQLYDRGFIFQDENPAVLRPTNGPARRSLLRFFLLHTPDMDTVDLDKNTAGYDFEKAVIRAVLFRKAEIQGRYYRQAEGEPSPNTLNLYAPDLILMRNNFSLPEQCPISLVAQGGGSVVIIPEDRKFKSWDFIHYSVSIGDNNNNKQKRIVTFVQVTVSEGEPTDSGLWTIDHKHQRRMIGSMSKDEVVGKVLQVLGVECSEIRYHEESKKGGQFVVSPTSKDDTVQFVLMSSCPHPLLAKSKKVSSSRSKSLIKNLIVVQRPEVEKALGIVFNTRSK